MIVGEGLPLDYGATLFIRASGRCIESAHAKKRRCTLRGNPKAPQELPREFKSGEVADPVHRYIRFTGIEREIIDHRITQRLRYVGQTGLAHLVYPELRTSRFSHSLGVMSLASKFLASSLRNAPSDVRNELLKVLNQWVAEIAGRFDDPANAASEFAGEPLEIGIETVGNDCPGIRLIEQALRLAALFHDLGHLPFSHNFEIALEELARAGGEARKSLPEELFLVDSSGSKLHERLGRRLSQLVLYEIIGDIPLQKQSATRIVFELAQTIFDTTEHQFQIVGGKGRPLTPKDAAILWLHTLIDGEIDVDRCDYILRDGRNYSFEFATVDLQRLVGNIVVVKNGDRFQVAILPHGLSAVEDFLLARYRSYQYGVRHHKVAQVGAALEYCISKILQKPGDTRKIQPFIDDVATLALAGTSDEDEREFKERFKDKLERSQFLRRYSSYDDVWWTGIMRDYDHQDEWFALVCARHSHPKTLWKWIGDFPRMDSIAEWNERLPKLDDDVAEADWFAEVLRLQHEHVMVVRHQFQPWQADNMGQESRLCVLKRDGELVPVTRLSRLVHSLRSAWAEELQVHVFAGRECTLTALDVCERLEAVMPKKGEK